MHDTTIGWRFRERTDGPCLWHRLDARDGRERGGGSCRGPCRSDAYALRSQARYDAGWHAADILPVTLKGRKGDTVVGADEHPRATTLEKLAALPTPFRVGGTVTAGNAAGINDGAAAVILASAEACGGMA